MELKLKIGYQELLELIRQLPLIQLAQLQADLEAELKMKEKRLPEGNKEAVLILAGSLHDAEAASNRQVINSEFETIEGEW